MDWTVDSIITRIKLLVGDSNLDDTDLLNRINDHYQNHLPIEFRPKSLDDIYHETLVADGVGVMVDPNKYLTLLNPAYIDDGGTGNLYEGVISYDPTLFWRKYPEPTALGTHTTNKPIEFLYYGYTLYPRPVPDADYEFECKAIKKPDAFTLGTEHPIEELWGGILSCDVAIEIKGERGDEENLEYLLTTLRPYYSNMIAEKEIMQLEGIRGTPRF